MMISTVKPSPVNFGLNSNKNLSVNKGFLDSSIVKDQHAVKVPVETHKAYALVSFEGKVKKTFPEALADTAREVAETMNTEGSCKKGVRLALEKHGILIKGISAYQTVDQLAKSSMFNEIEVARRDLVDLKPGTIIVWDKFNGHPDGHISVALGDGLEASDCIRPQFTNYGPRYRVFEPKSSNSITNKIINRPLIPIKHMAYHAKTACFSLAKGIVGSSESSELASSDT